MYNFSFIIPHKNCPDLLQRCVDSIPNRDDVQIIVVDDNSDDGKKPSITRPNVIIVSLNKEESNGAGHARNEGLKKAECKWVLFIDCDDTYTGDLPHLLDKYRDSNADVIYFNYNQIKGDSVNNKMFSMTNMDNDSSFRLKYSLTMPWNKMVKREFIEKHCIHFEECPVGNDIFYTYQVGYYAKENFIFDNSDVYNYYINTGSIVHRKKGDEKYYLTIFKHIYQRNMFYEFLGRNRKRWKVVVKFFAILKKKGIEQMVFAIQVYRKYHDEIINTQNYFVENIKK